MSEETAAGHVALKRILLAVDDSTAARRALQYVGEIVAGRSDFHVDLYHRLPALPPDLREHGGSELPRRETELGRELSARIAEWVSSLREDLRGNLEILKEGLLGLGMAADRIDFCIDEDVFPGEPLTAALCRIARKRGCNTIAVSLHHVPIIDGFEGFLSRHTGDALVRHGTGFAVWVIE